MKQASYKLNGSTCTILKLSIPYEFTKKLVAFMKNSMKGMLSKMRKNKHENKKQSKNKITYKFKGLLVTHLKTRR